MYKQYQYVRKLLMIKKDVKCWTETHHEDERGLFNSIFKIQNNRFKSVWKKRQIMQVNMSKTYGKGVLKGLHYQKEPHEEAKLISCVGGTIYDVVLDLRKNSESYGYWNSYILSEKENNRLFIPEGCAHGYQALSEETELIYVHSAIWEKSCDYGINPLDRELGIEWPEKITLISERDRKHPMLKSIELTG